jgi:hypothetical protein
MINQLLRIFVTLKGGSSLILVHIPVYRFNFLLLNLFDALKYPGYKCRHQKAHKIMSQA